MKAFHGACSLSSCETLGQWRQIFFGSSVQNEGVGEKPVAAVPPGRPEPEQEVAISGGIMGTGRKLKGESQLQPLQKVCRVPEERASCARCGTHAIGSSSLR